MFGISIREDFKINEKYVLQRIKFDRRIVRNIDAAYQMINNNGIMNYFCAIPRAKGDDLASNIINLFFAAATIVTLAREPHNYVIVDKSDKKKDVVCGCLAFRPDANGDKQTLEMSMADFDEYRRKGLMTGAIRIMIPVIFADEAVQKIEAVTLPDNIPSQKALEKFGFTYERSRPAPKSWFRHENETVLAYGLSRQ